MNKVEPQIISPWATGPNRENTPWPQNFKKGGNIDGPTKRERRAGKAFAKGNDKKGNRILDKNTKGMDLFKKGGSKNGYQNGPAGFGY